MPTRLGGVDYAVLPHGFLAMHSNKGMTLSLDQLRKLHPQKRFSRFRCIAGNTSSDTTPVDLFILVDGIVAFQKKALVGADGPIGIQIPIQPQNRFLTIVSAQSNESMHDNFLLLGDPVLDYASQ